jgi:hypothetical protein
MPDLDSVESQKRYPSELVVRLTLDPIIARLTIDDPRATPSGSGAMAAVGTGQLIPVSDYLTSEGTYVAYQSTQIGSGNVLPLIRVVDWGVRPVPGTLLFEPEMLTAIQQAETQLTQQFGQGIRERVVYLRAQEFHLQTAAYSLWFDRRSSVEDHLKRYRIFLGAAGKEGASTYVDLRLSNRVVYR